MFLSFIRTAMDMNAIASVIISVSPYALSGLCHDPAYQEIPPAQCDRLHTHRHSHRPPTARI